MIISNKATLVTFLILSGSVLAENEAPEPAADCVINPSKTVEVSAAISGLIDKVHVESGDFVHEGQLLAELKSSVQKANVELAKARAAIKSDISVQSVNLKYDKLQSARVEELNEKRMASEQNTDEAARIEEVTYWRLQQAKETHHTRQLELKRAIAQLEETRIYSPYSGYISNQYKDKGEYLEDEPVFQLVDLSNLHVETVLPMEYFGKYQRGQLGQVFLETDPEEAISAKLEEIDQLGDAASGTFGVKFKLANPDLNIPAGMKCVVQFTTDQFVSSSNEAVSDTQESETSLQANQSTQAEAQQQPMDDRTSAEKIGPFENSLPNEVVSFLKQLDVPYSTEGKLKKSLLGYLVLSQKDEPLSSQEQLNKYEGLGITGMMIMPRKNYSGRISFGAYNGPQSAEIRVKELQSKGVASEAVPRYKTTKNIYLSVTSLSTSERETILKYLN